MTISKSPRPARLYRTGIIGNPGQEPIVFPERLTNVQTPDYLVYQDRNRRSWAPGVYDLQHPNRKLDDWWVRASSHMTTLPVAHLGLAIFMPTIPTDVGHAAIEAIEVAPDVRWSSIGPQEPHAWWHELMTSPGAPLLEHREPTGDERTFHELEFDDFTLEISIGITGEVMGVRALGH